VATYIGPAGDSPRWEALMQELQGYSEQSTELGRHFAVLLGLHSTDAQALMEITAAETRGVPLSPARLGSKIFLSPAATTALLNRLEEAGHIVRSRESDDRRLVTLRSSPAMHEHAERFFQPLADRLDTIFGQFPPELLDRFQRLLAQVRGAMSESVTRPLP